MELITYNIISRCAFFMINSQKTLGNATVDKVNLDILNNWCTACE